MPAAQRLPDVAKLRRRCDLARKLRDHALELEGGVRVRREHVATVGRVLDPLRQRWASQSPRQDRRQHVGPPLVQEVDPLGHGADDPVVIRVRSELREAVR
eukprot:369423-Pyramimonas_sp.AAC.1